MSYRFPKHVPVAVSLVFLTVLLAGCAAHADGRSPRMHSGAGMAKSETPMSDAVAASSTTSDGEAGSAPTAAAHEVTIDNFTFSPQTLTVPVGAKVTWINHDDVPHTATSKKKPREIDSKTLDTDDKYAHVFKAAGTYDYFCAVHPHMTGKIIVK